MMLIRNLREGKDKLSGPPDEAKNKETWEGHLKGKSVKRLVIYLRSSGCSWAMDLQKPGQMLAGCLDCEHSVAETTYGKPISAEDYIKQFRGKYQEFEDRECPILCLYNEGSFFNEKELPAEARKEILRDIAKNPKVKRLVLESLPNYISDQILTETTELLGDVELEIGVGLESSNDIIRDLCIHKPYSLNDFERISGIVKRHCRLLAYVMLKPSFLSEKEALDDAISTVKYAFKTVRADAVSIEPVSIGRFTMTGVLNHLQLYRPAWLWSVLECAKIAANLGEVRIGGYQFAPSYLKHAKNCQICTDKVRNEIRLFNETYRLSDLEKISHKCCIEKWQAELARDLPPLEERIKEQLDRIDSFLDDTKQVEAFVRGQRPFTILGGS
jgi:hypothetical protein